MQEGAFQIHVTGGGDREYTTIGDGDLAIGCFSGADSTVEKNRAGGIDINVAQGNGDGVVKFEAGAIHVHTSSSRRAEGAKEGGGATTGDLTEGGSREGLESINIKSAIDGDRTELSGVTNQDTEDDVAGACGEFQ